MSYEVVNLIGKLKKKYKVAVITNGKNKLKS